MVAATLDRPRAGRLPADENALSQADRDALVLSCVGTVKGFVHKLAHAREDRDLKEELTGEAMLVATRLARVYRPQPGEVERLLAGRDAGGGKVRAAFPTFVVGHLRKTLFGRKVEDYRRRESERTGRAGTIARTAGRLRGRDADDDSDADPVEAMAAEIADEVGSAVRRVLFAASLERLTPLSRQVVELVAFDGVTVDQAAVRVGRTVKDVKLVIRNAAKTLSRPAEPAKPPKTLSRLRGAAKPPQLSATKAEAPAAPAPPRRAAVGLRRLRGRPRKPHAPAPAWGDVAAFLAERCDVRPGLRVGAGDLWACYARWCCDRGETPLGKRGRKAFGSQLPVAAPGVTAKGATRDGRWVWLWAGIDVRPAAAGPETAGVTGATATSGFDQHQLHSEA